MKLQKKAIVIGGGIAGLSAGCYLQKNGFDAHIFEMAPSPGGVTSVWKRNGYTFDGGTNWFPGSGPRLNFYPLLNELLDFKNHPIVNFDTFMKVRLKGGETLDVYTDAQNLRNEMLRIAPEDKKTIDTFITAIQYASKLKLPVEKAKELFSVFDYIKLGVTSLPLGLFYHKWRKLTIADYAQRFSNPVLRQLFLHIFPRHSYFSVLGMIMPLAWMNIEAAGYPVGGSEWVISSLCNTLEKHGGTITYSSKTTDILINNKKACGVVLSDGTKVTSDCVVAACDGYSTHYQLLGGKYVTRKMEQFFKTTPVFPALIQISIGLKKNLSQFTHKTVLEFSPPIVCGNDSINVLQVRFCHFDSTLSPQNGTAVIIHLRTHDYNYWVNLRKNDPEMYKKEKKRITERVITLLEEYCGPLRTTIEIIDTATPATYIRYTNTYKGSYQSWAPVPKLIGNSLDKKITDLDNFYMCGQWVEPAGGLTRAIVSARNVVQIICADNGKKFFV